MKYSTLVCKDIGIRKSEFVAMTRYLKNPPLNVACGAGQDSLRGGGTLAGVSGPVGADSFRRTGGGLLTFLLQSNCSYILVV